MSPEIENTVTMFIKVKLDLQSIGSSPDLHIRWVDHPILAISLSQWSMDNGVATMEPIIARLLFWYSSQLMLPF